jgi:hypothetical protein
MQMVNFITEEPDIEVPADMQTLMQVFGLAPMEARFMQSMLVRGWSGKEELPEVSFSIRQQIYKLRKKLEPRRVWIINDASGRYSIPPSSKRVVRQIIEAALANSGE